MKENKISRRSFLKFGAAASAAGMMAAAPVAANAAQPDADAAADEENCLLGLFQKPKYIFLFIGDGMGTAQIQSARFYKGTVDNNGAVTEADLSFTSFPTVGSVTTYDSTSFCPDSASTATSIATGHKTESGVINMCPWTRDVPYETIAEKLHAQKGYKVGIICQPDWTDPASITVLGEPRLGFLVSAGNMDSMVNHYSVTKHRRHTDAYTPGGEEGHRPNRAVTVYGNLIRQTFKDAPIIIGGIEASLRRLAHYDYWQDKLKRSVLLDSGADILIYGMGEHAIVEIADALDAGLPIDQITYINGTVYRTGSLDEVYDYDLLPSWDDLAADKLNYARSFNVQQQNMDPITGHRLVEPYPNSVYVVQNPPSATLTTDEMDEVAELPYARDWHPDYDAAGGVPA